MGVLEPRAKVEVWLGELTGALEEQCRINRGPDLLERLDQGEGAVTLTGDKVMKTIWEALNGFNWKPAPHQIKFHRSMLMSMVPLIYGDDWENYAENIRQSLRLEEGEKIKQQVVISTPRRYGKTVSVAMFCAALLYALPGHQIACFSPFGRQSDLFTDMVYKFFIQLPNGIGMVAKKNNEKLITSPNGREIHPNANTLYSMKGNAEGNRGITAQIVILEEAAFIPAGMFFDIVMPLMNVKHTAVIGISTPPKTHMNYYLGLFETKYPGTDEKIFNTLVMAELCNECQRLKKTECPHVSDERPAWKTLGRLRMTAALAANNESVYRREVLGAAETDHIAAFEATLLQDFFFKREKKSFVYPPEFVFTFVDPCEGGKTSDTAWTTVAYHPITKQAVVSEKLFVY